MGCEAITAIATLGTGLAHLKRLWKLLADVVRIHRTAQGEAFCENFEMLYGDGRRWEERTR
jgi:hypothetical protein